MEDLNKVISKQSWFGKHGLYFCGFYVFTMGMWRQIGIEAKKIVKSIANERPSNILMDELIRHMSLTQVILSVL